MWHTKYMKQLGKLMKSESRIHLYLTTESEDHTQTRRFQFGQILKIS